jgi:cytochrome b
MNNPHPITPPRWIKWLHSGLAVFGVTAYLTAELAENPDTLGYLLHAYLGLTLLIFLLSRYLYGFWGKQLFRFSHWFPYNKAFFTTILEDIHVVKTLKLPERQDHKGVAGLVQAFGLLVFTWMAITGALMFIPNIPALSLWTELHEYGEVLVPLFLAIHVGAVVLHLITGQNILSRMIPFLPRDNKRSVISSVNSNK